MQFEAPTKSKSLRGVTDLTLLAPVKPGLIPALDARSYVSRLKLLFRTLGTLRSSSLEAEPTPLIKDAVDRIKAIHSFRLALVGMPTKPQLLLSVAFDGGWEPYMRRIWGDLGPLLDVIFCNCDGYRLASGHSFPEYMAWVRSAQVETEFFYNASAVTVADLDYLRESARLRIDYSPAAGAAAETSAEKANREAANAKTAGEEAEKRETYTREALPALVALYRLCDMYPPAEAIGGAPDDQSDGSVLQRAAVHLLYAVAPKVADPRSEDFAQSATERAALCWFQVACKAEEERTKEAQRLKDTLSRTDPPRRANIQWGILEQDPGITYGGLVLISLRDAAAAAALIKALEGQIQPADAPIPVRHETRAILAFTPQGLRVAGVADGTLAELPREFLEGMAARASVLGDLRENHPSRWRLPTRNWPAPMEAPSPDREDPVELAGVDAVVQFTWNGGASMEWEDWLEASGSWRPLVGALQSLHDDTGESGVVILSVQPVKRFLAKADDVFSREHFGFQDGFSQPTLDAGGVGAGSAKSPTYSNQVAPGDLLIGYPNSRGDPALAGRLWTDSTFLVVRKLKQDVAAFETALRTSTAPREDALRGLIGRRETGVPATGSGTAADNNFDYTGDPFGKVCPLHAHVRRANPRLKNDRDGSMGPRILRRGMSYGRRFVAPPLPPDSTAAQIADDRVDRGLVFLSYQASIAEQFEVIQSWLSGGNASGPGTYSAQRDPLLGLRDAEDPCTVVFGPKGQGRVVLPPKPLVTLEWGLYLFVPSIAALGELKRLAQEEAQIEAADPVRDPSPNAPGAAFDPNRGKHERDTRRKVQRAVEAQTGAAVIAGLRQAEQALGFEAARTRWKIALEDVSARMAGTSRAVWTAVRELHGGVLRTPYGVLVCSPQRVREVFDDDGGRYSVSGYAERMDKSFGRIYLGRDTGTAEYAAESATPNAAIMDITRKEAFKAAFVCLLGVVRTAVPSGSEATVEVKELVDRALEKLSRHFFGIPDAHPAVGGGGFTWNWRSNQPPTCPGHFHAPSRYMFQPHPGPEASRAGQCHGEALKTAVLTLVEAWVRGDKASFGCVGNGLLSELDHDLAAMRSAGPPRLAEVEKRKEQFASTLIGVMMGFLPTVDGNLRGLLYEWVNDRSLWDHQIAFLEALRTRNAQTQTASTNARTAVQRAFDAATAELLPPLKKTLKLRPVPEVVWRTATEPHALGSVDVKPGDTIVASIVSATQASLLGDDDEVVESYRTRNEGAIGLVSDDHDLWALFGGVRRTPADRTHACPGAEMAIGVMLGVLAALLHDTSLRPTLSPMSLKLRRRPLKRVPRARPKAAPACAASNDRQAPPAGAPATPA